MNHESQLIETFRQEAYEHLIEVEEILLDMEQDPEDREGIHRLFRAMHTIKGSGAMFGFDRIAGFTHHVETLLDKVREGEIPVTTRLIDLIFLSRDQIKRMLDAEAAGEETDPSLCETIADRLKSFMPSPPASETAGFGIQTEAADSEAAQQETVYRIRFRPNPGIMAAGMDPLRLIDEIRELGPCEVVPHVQAVPRLKDLNPEQIFIYWNVILTTESDVNAIRDVFIFVEDDSEIRITPLDEEQDETDPSVSSLGEILVDRGEVPPEKIQEALNAQKKIGEILVESGAVSGEDVESALLEQKILEKRRAESKTESIRVSSEKLDRLINLVGELVIAQAHLSQVSEDVQSPRLTPPVMEVERLTGELREFALDMRMLPVGALFGRFRRMVRDLSAELNKETDLVIEGGETELDKTILDRIHDPLVHLIRNSIDHGIQPPDAREGMGRPRKGLIRLSAAHHGTRVEISVSDDGAGMNRKAIREKAVAGGIISPDARLPDEEIIDLIFEPGFSTAGEVTDVSGRGVGMDVVKREITSLGGTITVRSVPGTGSTVRLSLPLTLAIIEGLQVRAGNRNLILPVSQVEACTEVKRDQEDTGDGSSMIRLKEAWVPYIRLREIFSVEGSPPPVEHLAVIQAAHSRIGIIADEIIGNVQTVIKPLDRFYRRAKGISGATIMGDGTVALIVDLPELVRHVKTKERKQFHSA